MAGQGQNYLRERRRCGGRSDILVKGTLSWTLPYLRLSFGANVKG
jgi:hypothetical protein